MKEDTRVQRGAPQQRRPRPRPDTTLEELETLLARSVFDEGLPDATRKFAARVVVLVRHVSVVKSEAADRLERLERHLAHLDSVVAEVAGKFADAIEPVSKEEPPAEPESPKSAEQNTAAAEGAHAQATQTKPENTKSVPKPARLTRP